MIFKEHLKQQLEQAKADEYILQIQTNRDYDFKFHEDCDYELYDDFVVLTDEKSGANISIRYDQISFTQEITMEAFMKQLKSLDTKEMFEMLMSD